MKNKKWLVPACCILLAAFILGVTGAVDLTKSAETGSPDTFVGVLVTRDSIFSAGDMPNKYADGRVWTSGSGSDAFGELEGFHVIAPVTYRDGAPSVDTFANPAVSDIHVHIDGSDDSEDVTLTGSIWFVPQKDEEPFFCNPVYQTADGRLYALPGQCVILSKESGAGASMSMSIREEQHFTGTEGRTVSRSLSVSITVTAVNRPKQIRILQFSADHAAVKTDSLLTPEDPLPDSLALLPQTEYVIVETVAADPAAGESVVTRELCNRSDGYLVLFSPREDGLCIRKQIEMR